MQHPWRDSPLDIIGIAPGNPAAGSAATFTVPVSCRIKLISVTYVCTTDANVASRLNRIALFDGAGTLQIGAAPVIQTASSVRQYQFNVGITSCRELLAATPNLEWCDLNNEAWARAGDSFLIGPLNIQAGDQLTALYIRYVQEIYPLEA